MIVPLGIFHLECHYNLKKKFQNILGKQHCFCKLQHIIYQKMQWAHCFMRASETIHVFQKIRANGTEIFYLGHNFYHITPQFKNFGLVHTSCSFLFFRFLFFLCPTPTVFLSLQATFQPFPTWNSEATRFCFFKTVLISSNFLSLVRDVYGHILVLMLGT